MTTYEDEDNFKNKGIYQKYKLLFGKKLKKVPDVPKLVAIRNAITHNEPDNQRETDLAKELSANTAEWAVEITEEFTEKLLGTSWTDEIKRLY